MSRLALETVEKILEDEFYKQGFSDMVEVAHEDGVIHMYKLENVAYGLTYIRKKESLALMTTTLVDDKPQEWRSLSSWLYDEKTSSKTDAISIGNDFLDIIRGPVRVKETKKIAKKKGDDRNVDPLFFFNRLIPYVPTIKDEMNKDRIEFGKIRFATITKSTVVPALEALAKTRSVELSKAVELFNEMYKDGDLDTRSIVLHGIFNSLSDEAMENITPEFSDELVKIYKRSRPLKGKDIKPEKVKKQSKIMSTAMENAKELQKQRDQNSR